MNYDDLVTQYNKITHDYENNIEGRNATTFEESLIYKNDIENILNGKFVKILDSFFNGRNKVFSLKVKFSESRYSNIFDSIQDFCKVSYGYYLAIDNLNNNIKNCSMEAFNEYCQEFTTLKEEYNDSKSEFEKKSRLYLDNCRAISDKKSDIDNLQNKIDNYQGGEPIEFSNWNTKISTLKKEIFNLGGDNIGYLSDMQIHLSSMTYALSELQKLLNEALEKGTAV